MDTLIVILIVGMATLFTVEFLSSFVELLPFDTSWVGPYLTLIASGVYHYILGTQYPMFVVGSLASAFVALTLRLIVERIATTYTEVRRGRNGVRGGSL